MGSSIRNRLMEILASCAREGVSPPSLRVLAGRAGAGSTNTVRHHLHALRREGWIRMEGFRTRSIRVLRGFGIPVLGQVAAGLPLENISPDTEELPLSPTLFAAKPAGIYALRVKGDSMTGASILDGDYAIILRQETVEHGEIAAVLVDGEGTLKRVHKSGRRVELRAENPRYPPMVLSKRQEVQVFGKMVGLVRWSEGKMLPGPPG